MINLSKEICLKFKEARKAKGLNQSALARAVGCQQSAISMFEGGMVTKLSDETVGKLSEFLGVPLEEKKEEPPSTSAEVVESSAGVVGLLADHIHGYCPNGQCPSNIPYVVEGRLFYRPARSALAHVHGKYCPHCGELLETRCPVCGAPLNEGACCATCGSAYVTPVLPEGIDVMAYARARREEIVQFRTLN